MATPTLTATNFTRINACDSATGWSNLGGGGSPSVNEDVVIQNTGSIGRGVDNGTGGYAYDLGAGNELDFSPGGANEGDHIFFWVNILQPSLINSAVLRLTEDTTKPAPGNSLDYEFFPATPYKGGWQRIVIDPRTTPSAVNGSATYNGAGLNAVRWIGFFFDMGNVAGTSPNCMIDAIDLGRGLIVTGGSASDKITWDDIETVANSSTNAYGLIEKRSGVYALRGEWQFGDASNNCYFEDTDKTVVFLNSYTVDLATTPNTQSSQAPNLNKIVVVEGTGTTDFINGVKIGTGDDASGVNGCTYQVTPPLDGVQTFASIDFSDADNTNVELFGCTFRGIVGGYEDDTSITFCADATNGPNHEVSGCTFDQSGLVDPGRVSMQNNVFSSTGQSSKFVPFDQVTAEDNSAASFTNLTNYSLRDSTNETLWSNTNDNTNDAVYFGLKNKFEGLDALAETVVDVSPQKVWEYWDGTTWSTLTVTAIYLSNGSGLSLAPLGPATNNYAGHRYTWTAPSDWSLTTINSGNDLFFVRHRMTGNDLTTGNAVLHWTFAHTPFNGAALLWNDNIDIVNSNFIANSDSDTNEKGHGIEHRSGGTATYTNLQFSGNDADILFTDTVGIVDSYDFSNADSNYTLNGTLIEVSQSFTGDGSAVVSAELRLLKFGSPTGNIVARIYAHSGTFGTSSVPSGPVLAESDPIDVSTISTSSTNYTFKFTEQITLTAATNYCLTVHYADGDGSNNIRVLFDNSSPSHSGNLAIYSGSWVAASDDDLTFAIYKNGLIITALSGADPTTYTVNDTFNNVTIITLINVTLTGLVASPATEVRVYDTGTTTEIDGQENVVSGSFTFQADATDFVDIVIHNIEYEYIKIENYDVPSTDVSIPIQQQFDRNYNNP